MQGSIPGDPHRIRGGYQKWTEMMWSKNSLDAVAAEWTNEPFSGRMIDSTETVTTVSVTMLFSMYLTWVQISIVQAPTRPGRRSRPTAAD